MEDLRELVKVVSKNKIKDIPTLDHQNGDDRVYDLYDKILSDEILDDDSAAKYFYKNPAQRGQYRKLKSKLRDRLFNTLFFIDVNNPKFSDAQKAFYQCNKELVVVRMLLGRYARKSAISLATRTLSKAQKFEIIDVVVELLRLLKNHHALYTGDIRSYKKYKDALKANEQILEAELMAVDYYDEIHVRFKKNLVLDKETRKLAQQYIGELEEVGKKIKTFRLHLMRFGLINLVEALENNHERVVENCDQAIRFFSKKPNVSPHFLGTYYYNKLLHLAKLGDYVNGQKIARKCLRLFEPGTLRWFKTNELFFLLCMHTKKYNKALGIVTDVLAAKEFEYQAETRLEFWRLAQAYLYYLHKVGRLDKSDHLKSFRIKKFLNEVPKYSSDKRGYNIPVLIIQILILIHHGAYDQLSDQIEAIEKYSTRYLRKDTNYRSNCFIKMLLQVPKRQFHKVAVVRHAGPYLKRLGEDNERSNQAFEMEIIPYEHLWDLVLESLDKKFH